MAELFYITQGHGIHTWVVALSSRTDTVELIYDAYGFDGTKPEDRLRTFSRPRDITYWPCA